MKHGTKVITSDNYIGTVLGPEDFDMYDYNRPSEKWELIDYGDGVCLWTGNNILEEIS